MAKRKTEITPGHAKEILDKHNPERKDFHALHSSDVEGLHSAGKALGYKKSATSPGSYGRAFHSHLEKIERRGKLKEEIQNMVDAVLLGNKGDAQDIFTKLMSQGVADALADRRKEIAANLFQEASAGDEDDESEEDDETELTPEQKEILDSLSDEEIDALLDAEDFDEDEITEAVAEINEGFDEILEAWTDFDDEEKTEYLVQIDELASKAIGSFKLNRKVDVIKEDWDKMSHEAKELVLHGDNTSHLHFQSHQPIMANLKKKAAKGKYDHEKAKKLWSYHADRVAQSYHKEHGSPHVKWHHAFPTKVRKEAAKHWADHNRDEIEDK